ncbi:Na(+)/citrate cotransporter-like [Liolophura sinensis]|uniref:Na(+)/citrate cotransporter-like n=1 Tax=Liolophura sinensis TaxID=3198878 RepID=UPI003158835C
MSQLRPTDSGQSPTITIIGVFSIVSAAERWGLHKRMALRILTLFGTKPHWLIFGMLVCTSILSVFITAGVAVLMIPIVHSVVDKLKNVEHTKDIEMQSAENNSEHGTEISDDGKINREHRDEVNRLFKAFSLCICYGTAIGSSVLLTGGPPNLVTFSLTEEFYSQYGLPSKLTFLGWFIYAAPVSVIVVLLTWVWLVILFLRGRGLFRRSVNTEEMKQAEERVKEHLNQEYKNIGPWSYPEKVVVMLTVILVILFLTEDLYFVPGWDSLFKKGYVGSPAPVCLITALLFIIPAKSPRQILRRDDKDCEDSKFAALLTWKCMLATFPWGIVLIIGAAFSLVKACKVSGLTGMIAGQFELLVDLEPWVITLVITVVTSLLTEFISNSATIILLLPIVGQIAILVNLDPLAFIFPMALSAKCAFMMPIASPPNAIAFSLGALQVKDMAMAGFLLNILSLLTINLSAHAWGKAYFRWDVIADEMRQNITSATI